MLQSRNAFGAILVIASILGTPAFGQAGYKFAVWGDDSTDPALGGSGIITSLQHTFGAGSTTVVTNAQMATPGFLNNFDAVILTRYDSQFGNSVTAAAAAGIDAYVGVAGSPNQGGVATFTNDMGDNLYGSTSGDPYDNNLNQLFVNAAADVAATHHGFIGELNGAIMAMATNSNGFVPLDLLQGNASSIQNYSPNQFVYDLGPAGSSNAIDVGVTFPFTDSDTSTFRTIITGADSSQIVDIYHDDGAPAVLANQGGLAPQQSTPEPASLTLMSLGALGMAGWSWRKRKGTKTQS